MAVYLVCWYDLSGDTDRPTADRFRVRAFRDLKFVEDGLSRTPPGLDVVAFVLAWCPINGVRPLRSRCAASIDPLSIWDIIHRYPTAAMHQAFEDALRGHFFQESLRG